MHVYIKMELKSDLMHNMPLSVNVLFHQWVINLPAFNKLFYSLAAITKTTKISLIVKFKGSLGLGLHLTIFIIDLSADYFID